jgi:hypothetical protein
MTETFIPMQSPGTIYRKQVALPRVTLTRIMHNKYKDNFAWGWDTELLYKNWDDVTKRALLNRRGANSEGLLSELDSGTRA